MRQFTTPPKIVSQNRPPQWSQRRGFVYRSVLWLLCCTAGGIWLLARSYASPPTPARPHVTKNIEDIKVGDYVMAKDPAHPGPPSPHRVTALPRNWTEHVVHVAITGGGEVQATRAHPLWVEGRGWTNASDLRVGDKLVNELGESVAIIGLRIEEKTTDTFNLTVEGVHTYYVVAANTSVLVHNVVVSQAASFDAARSQGMSLSGLDRIDPSQINMFKPDATGTYTEFRGPGGMEVNYDGPHADGNPALGHDKPHVGWQQEGKKWAGSGEKGNITYDGEPGPSRPSVKPCP